MYENPIEKIMGEIQSQVIENDENHLLCSVNQSIGYNVNKEELLKALQYDRHQYDKGYSDAIKHKKEILDLVCDINPEEIAAQIASGNLHNWCVIVKREFERLLNE